MPLYSNGRATAVCHMIYENMREYITGLARRVAEKGDAAGTRAIILVDAEEPASADIAKWLMPDIDPEPFILRGETPIAHGTVDRQTLLEILREVASEEAGKAEVIGPKGVPVAVFSGSVVRVHVEPLP